MPLRGAGVAAALVAAWGAGECAGRKALGVDLGGGVIRAAVATKGGVRQGVVLNSMSERAFPSVVGWRAPSNWDDPAERMLSETAKRLSVLAPNATVQNLRDLTVRSPLATIELYDGNVTTQPIDALAMVLKYVRSMSGSTAGTAVVSVPGYLRPSQRQSIVDAATIAGVATPQLLSEHAALAVAYSFVHNFGAEAGGEIRSSKSGKKAQRVMFISLSAHAAQASLVRYRLSKGAASASHNGRLIKQKVATVISTAFNNSIGVAVMQQRLLEDVLHSCEDPVLTAEEKEALLATPKLHARVATAVRRAMEMLTTTKDADIAVEDLLPSGATLKATVTREQLEALSVDVAEGVKAMIAACLKGARGKGLDASEVGSVELSGGGTRIPFIQAAIASVFDPKAHRQQKTLSHRLDKDEALAQGASVVATNATDPDPSVVILSDVSSHAYRLRVFPLKDAAVDILPAVGADALVDMTVARSAPLPHKANFDFDIETGTDAVVCIVTAVGEAGVDEARDGTALLPAGEQLEGLWVVSDFANEAKELEGDAKHQGFNVEKAKHPVTGKPAYHIRGRLGIKADERLTVGRMAVVRDVWKIVEVAARKKGGEKKTDKKKGKKDDKRKDDKKKGKDRKKEKEKDEKEKMSKKVEDVLQQALPVRLVSAKELEEALPASRAGEGKCTAAGAQGAGRTLYTELSKDEIHQRQRRLQRLQMQDERRLELSAAKNNLEHWLYVAREVLAELERPSEEFEAGVGADGGALADWKENAALSELVTDVRATTADTTRWAEHAGRDASAGDYNMHTLPLQRKVESLRDLLEARNVHVDVDEDDDEADVGGEGAPPAVDDSLVDDVVPEFVDLVECTDAVQKLRDEVQVLKERLAEVGHPVTDDEGADSGAE